MKTAEARLLAVLVEGYLLESSLGRITRGFATFQVSIVRAKGRLTQPELIRALDQLKAQSCVLVGEFDSQALDVSVTAVGLFRHGGGS